jgi:hypothetical protein
MIFVLDSTGNIELLEFRDYGLFTHAKVKFGRDKWEMLGLPISGKFYRIDDNQKKAAK